MCGRLALRPRRLWKGSIEVSLSDRQWTTCLRIAEAEVGEIVGSLPDELAEEARSLPVVFEPVPGHDLVADGLEPDTLGLFVGIAHPEQEAGLHDLPAQILLFLENLWSYARHDAHTFRAEVRTTYLHELGHYLGLNEDDMVERGLE